MAIRTSSTLKRLLQLPPSVRSLLVERVPAARCLSTSPPLRSHENPLGLPRSGTPPNLAARMKRGVPEKQPIPNVRHVIAVSSAKGGVGKSTLAANLALALSRHGLHTGLLDADIHGPSVPTLLGLEGLAPALTPEDRLVPLTAYGVRAMSMGLLVRAGAPVAWRGLLLQRALRQLLFEVAWPPGLDVLVVDLPPGTGDVPLTLAQSVALAGAVVVSTPQDLALRDAVRGVDLFRRVDVPILGMVQNMSTFTCAACGHRHDIFGLDGARRKCEEMGIELLGDIPLHPSICSDADAGKPTTVANPDSPQAQAFMGIAKTIITKLGM